MEKNKSFSIAQKLAIFSKGEISSVEGFITINGKNKWSAWNILKGKAFDLTNCKEASYVGIVIPYSLVKKHFVEQLDTTMVYVKLTPIKITKGINKAFSCLEDNYINGRHIKLEEPVVQIQPASTNQTKSRPNTSNVPSRETKDAVTNEFRTNNKRRMSKDALRHIGISESGLTTIQK